MFLYTYLFEILFASTSYNYICGPYPQNKNVFGRNYQEKTLTVSSKEIAEIRHFQIQEQVIEE